MLIFFVFLLTVFNFAYSFAVGLLLMVPFCLSKDKEAPWAYVIVSSLVGLAACAVQGLIVAQAVNVCLADDPSRWSALWYIVGFIWSVPSAMALAMKDPSQRHLGIAIGAANVAYLVGVIYPAAVFHPIPAIVRFLL